MTAEAKRPLKVFLCHASGDKPQVRALYKRLLAEGVDAWLDQEKLLPGQDWHAEITRAVKQTEVVVICLSNKSITKEGYIQREIRTALDSADEKPEGTIFLIPARLEDCIVPERLSGWQWVDLFEDDGFVRLLRSLKLRAAQVGAVVEPPADESEEEEIEHRLDQLYTEGLAAFYTEDWDRAYQRFQAILRERPNHKNAGEKLAQAEQRRDYAKLYAQATQAHESGNWPVAIKALEELLGKSGEYKDALQRLQDARKQKQLGELHAEAKKLHAAGKWQAVVRVFDQIHSIDPNHTDPDGLLPSAQKELEEAKRLAELNDLYTKGIHEMDSGKWYEARSLLEKIHKAQTGYLDTERLLRKVEVEIANIEERNKRNDQINLLYEQAHGLVRSKNWRKASEKIGEIRKLEGQFEDKDGLSEKIDAALLQEEQEAQKQNQLAAMYAEAVRLLKEGKYQEALDQWQEVKTIDSKYPDRQRVQTIAHRKLIESGKAPQTKLPLVISKLIWAGITGLILIGVVIAGVNLWLRGNEQTPPASTASSGEILPTIPTSTTVPASTNTSRPSTAVPTEVVRADPLVHDDFNNPTYDGRFNTDLWVSGDTSPGKIVQENGLLSLELSSILSNVGLNSNQVYQPTYPIFVESKMMLDPNSNYGSIFVGLGNSDGISRCGIETVNLAGAQKVACWSEYFGVLQRFYDREITPGTWHLLRIELYPDSMTFDYLLDGEKLGSYIPQNPEAYENLSYSAGVHVDSGTNFDPSVTGFADYVKFGKIEE